MKVLIADDDPLCRMLLRRVLAQVPGIEITEVNDGLAAWQTIERGLLPDLCILDVVMPGISGLQLLNHIRSNPGISHLRVVLCSTFNDRDHVTAAAKLRPDGYVVKPYKAETILREVSKVGEQASASILDETDDRVCARLSIDTDTLAGCKRMLFDQLVMLDGAVADIARRGNFTAAALEVNATKGACATLGRFRLSEALHRLERALLVAGDTGGGNELEIASSRSVFRSALETERSRIGLAGEVDELKAAQ